MHMTIGAIVAAEDEKRARASAERAFGSLVSEKHFDCYTLLESPVQLVESKKGKKTVDKMMGWTKQEWLENIRYIRIYLQQYTDEQLFEKESLGLEGMFNQAKIGGSGVDFRWRCYHAGEYAGNCTWIYDENGVGIRNPDALQDTLARMKKNTPKWKVYIVLADVHF